MPSPRRRPAATIVTVAREAGVHPSTASRALSGDPATRDGVAAATRTRVEDAAGRLGYRRNRVGASLRTGRTGVIGVLVPRITDIVVALAYEGLDARAREDGYVTLVSGTQEDLRTRAERIEMLLDHGVDAILFSDGHLDEPPAEDAWPVPVLPFMRTAGDRRPVVALDDADGGRQVARYLLGLGHTDLGVVAGPEATSSARDRARGFTDELARAGIRLAPGRSVHCAFDVEGGKEATARLLEGAGAPTAIFAVNDVTAIGAMSVARARGFAVPQQLSVVGFNDTPLAAELPVPLTTVRSPLRAAGAAAAEAALEAVAGREPGRRVLPLELVVRGSASAPRPTT